MTECLSDARFENLSMSNFLSAGSLKVTIQNISISKTDILRNNSRVFNFLGSTVDISLLQFEGKPMNVMGSFLFARNSVIYLYKINLKLFASYQGILTKESTLDINDCTITKGIFFFFKSQTKLY